MGRSRSDRLTRIASAAVASALLAAPVVVTSPSWAVPAPQDDATPSGEEWTPDSWRPSDPDVMWADAIVTQYEDDALGACVQGGLYEWHATDGLRVGLEWVRCDDSDAAAALIPSVLLQGNFPEASVAPVFGADADVATYQEDGSHLIRFWSQGGHYFSVARNCGMTPECEAATAAYATDLASAVGTALNDLPSVAPANDALSDFTPTSAGQEWARVSYTPVRGTLDERPGECEDGSSVVWMARDGTIARAFWWGCTTPRMAFLGFSHLWQDTSTHRRADLEGVLGQGADRAGVYLEGRGLARSWVQGVAYVNVQRDCVTRLTQECIDASAADVRAASALLPGDVMFDDRANAQLISAGVFFIVVPLATMLALFIVRVVIGNRGQRGYDTETESGAAFTAVDQEVRRARWGRAIRRLLLVTATAGVWLSAALTMTGPDELLIFGLWFFFGPVVLYVLFSALLRLVWRPSALARVGTGVRGRPSLAGAVGAGLSIAARVVGLLALIGYVFFVAMLIYTRGQLPSVNAEQIASLRATGTVAAAVMAFVQEVVVAIDAAGAFWAMFALMLVVPITAAYFLDRFGRRLRRRSLPVTLAADARPYFLYLRGFDEDRLRVTSSLTRRGFIESFTPFGRPRFEEVLVQYLSRFGPVIAISPRERRLSDLGAAKVSLEGDAWQDHVREWVGGAQAVVIAATPGEVRRGLAWEIAHVAQHDATPRVMLVVAPWPRTELARRWRGFVEHASEWPLFAPLESDPMPSGVQILTWTTDRGWVGYGARRRWDWTYAASILRAVQDAQPAWTRDREAEHVDATSLIEEAEAGVERVAAESAMVAPGGGLDVTGESGAERR